MSRFGNAGGRLYRGKVSVNFVGRKRTWYSISGTILLISTVALLVRGLDFSVARGIRSCRKDAREVQVAALAAPDWPPIGRPPGRVGVMLLVSGVVALAASLSGREVRLACGWRRTGSRRRRLR
jgi:hypothetical protein